MNWNPVSKVWSSMKRLSLVAVVFLVSCQSGRPFPKVVLGPDSIEPLWLSYEGCSGGIVASQGRISLSSRIVDEYETRHFEAGSGKLINVSYGPNRISDIPADTPADLTSGSARRLERSRTIGVSPAGFNPVILTGRFLFAERTRLRFSHFHFHFYSEGQVVVVDLPSKNIVWTDQGINIAVLAASGRVVVCSDRKASVFDNNAGRPREVSEFYAAVRASNAPAVRSLYRAWRKYGTRDVDGKVPLSVVAKDGRLDIAKLLIELGESPNGADSDGFTPLMMALLWNRADVANILLDAGAIPTEEQPLWGSALRIAVGGGRRPIINRLIRSGAKIDAVEGWSGHTVLHEAVMYRNYEAIETLIAAGANTKVRDKDGKTPAELAPMDDCVTHLLGGGLIKDKPAACQPIRTGTATFDGRGLVY